tara:strand:- start:1140 stop:1448 length:309 start_codon:yes stop_codon:yes gene_type:complete
MQESNTQKSDTVYLGNGKTATGQYGEFYNITINLNKVKENPNVVEEFKGTKFIRLRISKKQQPDQYGKNVNVVWADPSKIKPKTQETNNNPVQQDTSNPLPF